MTPITLPGRIIGPGRPCFVIAEAGVNHNGDLDLALLLVDAAADAGADAVKFQTFKTENIILSWAPKARYHVETTGGDAEQTWFELLKTQELTRAMHEAIIERCRARGILFLSTPYDEDSVRLLDDLDVALFKVASTDADNVALLDAMARTGRPVILSSAMSRPEEIKASADALRRAGCRGIAVLQCTGSYPAPADQANLKAMIPLAELCDAVPGYSDHVPGFTAAVAAIALGANVYEKHFTLDRALPGPDHRASVEPDELKELVRLIREAESLLGDGVKRIMPSEEANRTKLRKFVVARLAIAKGETIAAGQLTAKRTGGIGIEASALHSVVGRVAAANIDVDQPITEDLLEIS